MTRISNWGVAYLFVIFTCASFLNAADHDHDHGKDVKGPHGGMVHELGDAGDTHVEVLHDKGAGTLSIYLLAKDMKTPVSIKEAPKINLKSKKGNEQIDMKPIASEEGKASQFSGTHDELKDGHLSGRISITMDDGKKFNVKLDTHGHDHE